MSPACLLLVDREAPELFGELKGPRQGAAKR